MPRYQLFLFKFLVAPILLLLIPLMAISNAQSIDSFKPGDPVEVNHFGNWLPGEVVSKPNDHVALVKFFNADFGREIKSHFMEGKIRPRAVVHEFRTWKSASGKHTFRGRMTSIDGANVMIKKNKSSDPISVEIEKLSDEDKKYLADIQGNKSDKQPAAETGSDLFATNAAEGRDQQKKMMKEALEQMRGAGANADMTRELENQMKKALDDSEKIAKNGFGSNPMPTPSATDFPNAARPGTGPGTPGFAFPEPKITSPPNNNRDRFPLDVTDDSPGRPSNSASNHQPINTPSQVIKDAKLGFEVKIPAGFIELQIDGSSPPNTIHQYADREPSLHDVATVILVQRLKGQIDPNEKMDLNELRQKSGPQTTLEELPWNGQVRQVIRLVETDGFASYVVQMPMRPEAIQILVGGPAHRDAETRKLLRQTVQGFTAKNPTNGGNAGSVGGKLSSDERTKRLLSGLIRLGIFFTVLVFVGSIIGTIIYRAVKK